MEEFLAERAEGGTCADDPGTRAVRGEELRRFATGSHLVHADSVERAKRVLMGEKKDERGPRLAEALFAWQLARRQTRSVLLQRWHAKTHWRRGESL